MTGVQHMEVQPAEDAIRLDRFLKRHFPDLTHGHLSKLLRTGQLRVDGRRAEASLRLEAGQTVRVPPMTLQPRPAKAAAAKGELSPAEVKQIRQMVLYDDGQLVALNKPAGLAVQGGTGTNEHIDRLLPALDQGRQRCRLVHRLDRDTAGLLLLGRGAAPAAKLAESFRRGEVRKLYWALVRGRVREPEGIVNLALAKGGDTGRERMFGDDDGKPAKTLFRVVLRAGKIATWLALRPVTGRTHQLRAHCDAIGHPIIGDAKYGDDADRPGADLGLMLFAQSAAVPHPSGRTIQLEAPLPPHLKAGFDLFGFTPDAAHGFDLAAFEL